MNQAGLYLKGRAAYAQAACERALRIDEAAYGSEHPDVATAVNNLSRILRDQGDLPGARACYERALRIFCRFLGEEHPNTVKARNNLAALERQMKTETLQCNVSTAP